MCGIPITLISPQTTPTPQSLSRDVLTPITQQITLTPTNVPELVVQPTQTPIPTVPPPTPTATQTVAPTPTPVPTATTPPVIGLIPGLYPADVKLNLEPRGFSCSTADKGELYFSWTCTKDVDPVKFIVIFYGRNLLTVDYLESVVLQSGEPDDIIASDFLGFMATMPYSGAEPEAARTWVEETLPTIKENGDVRSAVFGTVPYQVFGWPPARNLEMGSLP